VRSGTPLDVPGGDSSIIVPQGLPVVAHATVSIPQLSLSTTTNSAGNFTLSVPAASAHSAITVKVTAAGFGTWRESGIELSSAGPANIYVQLQHSAQSLAVRRPVRQPYNGSAPGKANGRSREPHASGGRPDAYVPCGHNSSGWTSQTSEPPTIRVYMTGTGQVVRYDYTFYEEHVLPNEWDSSAPYAALQAGAEAVRDYARYFVLYGSKGTAADVNPCSFDVDDTTNYQHFVPSAPVYTNTNEAVTSTAGTVFSHDGAITETSYCNNFVTDCGADSPPDSCGEDSTDDSIS
jgi:peptidoglycan hydrolase-like amidase